MESVLKMSLGGFPPLSARGCTQTLVPINQGHFVRTINGEGYYIGPASTKYKSVVACKDKVPLATQGLHLGEKVWVECIQSLWQKVDAGEEERQVRLERMPVEGSVQGMTEDRESIPLEKSDDPQIFTLPPLAKPLFIAYRPVMEMFIRGYELFTDEWGLCCGWKLELEEV